MSESEWGGGRGSEDGGCEVARERIGFGGEERAKVGKGECKLVV